MTQDDTARRRRDRILIIQESETARRGRGTGKTTLSNYGCPQGTLKRRGSRGLSRLLVGTLPLIKISWITWKDLSISVSHCNVNIFAEGQLPDHDGSKGSQRYSWSYTMLYTVQSLKTFAPDPNTTPPYYSHSCPRCLSAYRHIPSLYHRVDNIPNDNSVYGSNS